MVVNTIIAAVAAIVVTAVSGFIFIPWLHRLKAGQQFKEIGPTWHQKKLGTPTMGGFMFILGVIVAVIVGLVLDNSSSVTSAVGIDNEKMLIRLVLGLVAALLFGGIGFIDDYLKVVRHNNKGLRGWFKIFFQVGVSVLYLGAMALFGGQTSVVSFPFIGSADLGIFFWILSVIMIVGVVNSVNLTDGLDGLNSSVTCITAISFMFVALFMGSAAFSTFGAAVAGGCIGFLFWNFYPAKVMMGDTGSMFLGGSVIALAYGLNQPVLLVLAGIIYFCEAASDIIQVGYYKLTHGKRIFKMAPIHHHFEMCGMSEIQICFMFSAVQLVGGALAFLSVAI